MYRRAMSTRLSRGRSTPAIRAMPFSPSLGLALPLLVPRVRADDPDDATPADDLALVAHRLDRRPNLHRGTSPYLYLYVMRPRVRSYGESSTRTRSPGRIRM